MPTFKIPWGKGWKLPGLLLNVWEDAEKVRNFWGLLNFRIIERNIQRECIIYNKLQILNAIFIFIFYILYTFNYNIYLKRERTRLIADFIN